MNNKDLDWKTTTLPPLQSGVTLASTPPVVLPSLSSMVPLPNQLPNPPNYNLTSLPFSFAPKIGAPYSSLTRSRNREIKTQHVRSDSSPQIQSTQPETNLDPEILERRRKNAEASTKSRIRRRIREIKLQEKNHELEDLVAELKANNEELKRQLFERINSQQNLLSLVNNIKENCEKCSLLVKESNLS